MATACRRSRTVFERFDPATTKFSILRLHGPNRDDMEKRTGKDWNRIVAARDDDLRAAANIVLSNVRRSVVSYVNVNNHYEGSAPLTIERFLRLLEEEVG